MNELKHYGTLYYSGRYPWGSGENPYQRWKTFYGEVQKLRSQGMKDTDIAKGMGITTTQMRNRIAYGKDDKRYADATMALKLHDKNWSNKAIADRMGINESSVRSLLDPVIFERTKITGTIAQKLKDQLAQNDIYIDVGKGTANHLGVTEHKLAVAVQKLQDDGYSVHIIQEKQPGTGMFTKFKVLAPPDTPWVEVQNNRTKIQLVDGVQVSPDGGRTFRALEKPRSIDSKRILVKYAEDGGLDRDGLIELRRGVDDISLGNAKYAQVRIAVDDSHYIKGMAVHSDKMPKGVDVIFYTNKPRPLSGHSKDVKNVLKEMKKSDENPFGANIKLDDELIRAQRHYIDKDGKEQLSAINIVNEEGNWNKWSRNLSSQFLSKQQPEFAKQQLKLAYDIRKEEYDEISQLTNPVVKRRMLEAFADKCDSDSVHLKAAAMPRQRTQVILPIDSLKDNEIYAPNYRNGEPVVLIRYPHGGRFEIPELVVNNKNKEAQMILGSSKSSPAALDAVGINSRVARILSGADFDGDTVVVIPNHGKEIKTHPALEKLKNFDPVSEYPEVPNMKVMGTKGGGDTNLNMGNITNLINDMSAQGANWDEIAMATRHSMVVIDAEKHRLNYTKSYTDHNIAALKRKYQGGANRGASTLMSRSSAVKYVDQFKDYKKIDKETGELIFEKTGKTYVDKKGVTKKRLSRIPEMMLVKDAFELSSGTRIETEYATHANRLKALANSARKQMINVKSIPYSPSAKAAYAKEVDSLLAALNNALKNAPLERQAIMIANAKCAIIFSDNPGLDNDDKKKIRGYELKLARSRMGAAKQDVWITDKQWQAIQAGAFTNTRLTKIIENANLDRLRELSTPRSEFLMTPGKMGQAKAMLGRGYTQSEVADHLGVSVSTLIRALEP